MRSGEWVVFWFAFVRCRIVSRVQLRCVTSANASVNCATADAQVGHQRKSLTWRHTTNTDRRPHRRRPSTAVRQQPQQQKQQQHYIKYMRRIRKKQLKNLRDKKTWNEWEFDWGRPTTATAACNEAYHLDMNTHSTQHWYTHESSIQWMNGVAHCERLLTFHRGRQNAPGSLGHSTISQMGMGKKNQRQLTKCCACNFCDLASMCVVCVCGMSMMLSQH